MTDDDTARRVAEIRAEASLLPADRDGASWSDVVIILAALDAATKRANANFQAVQEMIGDAQNAHDWQVRCDAEMRRADAATAAWATAWRDRDAAIKRAEEAERERDVAAGAHASLDALYQERSEWGRRMEHERDAAGAEVERLRALGNALYGPIAKNADESGMCAVCFGESFDHDDAIDHEPDCALVAWDRARKGGAP